MSYCRFSSDNWKSDVYVYVTDYGYCLHIAGQRVIEEIPELPNPNLPQEEWLLRTRIRNLKVHGAERVDITLPHAGETMFLGELKAVYEELLHLRTMGYRVPQFALDNIQQEIEEDERERLSACGTEEAGRAVVGRGA